MPAPVPHHHALGIHPGAFVQPTEPDTTDVQDGVLWIDNSTDPPYALKVWNATASAWQSVTGQGALYWDHPTGTWIWLPITDVEGVFGGDLPDGSDGPFIWLRKDGALRYSNDVNDGVVIMGQRQTDGHTEGGNLVVAGTLEVREYVATSGQSAVLRIKDDLTNYAVDLVHWKNRLWIIGPHTLTNLRYYNTADDYLLFDGLHSEPVGIIALDSGADVKHGGVRLGIFNSDSGPSNEPLWIFHGNRYGEITLPALGAHAGQTLRFTGPRAPDSDPRLIAAAPSGTADLLTVPSGPPADVTTCTQVKCAVSALCLGHLSSLYDQWARWLSPLFVVAGTALAASFLDELGVLFLGTEVVAADVAVWLRIRPILSGLIGAVTGNLLPGLTSDQRADVQKMLFCALSCEGDVVTPSVEMITVWHDAMGAYSGWAISSLQGELMQLLTEFTPIEDWILASSTATSSSACDSWTCP